MSGSARPREHRQVGLLLYNEADTRAKLINPKVHASGWDEERIKRELYFTKGQIYLVGDKGRRKYPLKADDPLRYNAALALALPSTRRSTAGAR